MSATCLRTTQHDLTVLGRRPVGPPPPDARHEWLTEWMASDAPEVHRWCAWFLRTNTPFKLVVVVGCSMRCTRHHDHVYEWAMIYVHRLLTPRNAKARIRWCCEEGPIP